MPSLKLTKLKKRGQAKWSVPHNLLERLQTYQRAVLGFMDNSGVLFDNAQAEHDLWMMKMKKSGYFLFVSKALETSVAFVAIYPRYESRDLMS